MSLKIIMKSLYNNPPHLNIGNNVKVIDLNTGIDISNCVRNIDIKIRQDKWVTAIIECDVGELELTGVDIEEIKSVARNNYKENVQHDHDLPEKKIGEGLECTFISKPK